ncbi:DUF6221 family protein [Streptomyces sp. NBC_00035]|uniref:DUF6221 family protein n=1 Tax=Streptomyces sp. NBC_00035 TaxID=2903614 RepID=UPI003250A37D
MDELVEELARWLDEQLDEDERITRAAHGRTDGPLNVKWWTPEEVKTRLCDDQIHMSDAEHIARHDPARVLREIEAKRRIIAEVTPEPREPETDTELHARFAHPAWRYRTTSGPRKQWDDIDRPPHDEEGEPEPGWERNVDAGRPGEGWDRFDYTEESYWRRRVPEGEERKPYVPMVLRLLALPYADREGYRAEWAPTT